MNAEPIRESLKRWSLKRVQFLLSHLEDFIDDDEKALKERARSFVSEGGLDKIENLVEADPADPHLPVQVFERLAAFFDAGLLLQRGPAQDQANWWTTDIFWRGSLFHLELPDQVHANRLVPEMPPLQVNRAPAQRTLQLLNLDFLSPGPEANAYLIKPTPTVAYMLISNLADPWSPDHIAHAHRLVNKCFIY